MKKSILVVTFFSFLTGYSQTEKGKRFLGGQLNFSNMTQSQQSQSALGESTYDFKNLQFQFEPDFGCFIKDNFAIGINLNFGVNSLNGTSSNDETNIMNYGAGGFARHYSKIADKFYFIIDGKLNYKFTQVKYENRNDQNIHSNQISLSIGPGLIYFITPKLGLQTSFGSIFYNIIRSKATSQFANHSNSDSYGINLNMSALNFGLSYYF